MLGCHNRDWSVLSAEFKILFPRKALDNARNQAQFQTKIYHMNKKKREDVPALKEMDTFEPKTYKYRTETRTDSPEFLFFKNKRHNMTAILMITS